MTNYTGNHIPDGDDEDKFNKSDKPKEWILSITQILKQ